MNRLGSRLIGGTVLMLSAFAGSIGSASATTSTLGVVAPLGSNSFCISCTSFQPANDGLPVYQVPAGDFTITSWSMRGGPTAAGHARLRVFRPTGVVGNYELIAESDEEVVPANASPSFATHIDVQGGDVLGLRTGTDPGDLAISFGGDVGDLVSGVIGDPVVGDTVGSGATYSYNSSSSALLNISATLYGPDPTTTITGHPPHRTASGRAAFRFRSDAPNARFECRLDGRRFRRCSSPKVYTGLATGRHRVAIRAIDEDDNVDPSAEGWRWRVTS